jgi:hypothetical protein
LRWTGHDEFNNYFDGYESLFGLIEDFVVVDFVLFWRGKFTNKAVEIINLVLRSQLEPVPPALPYGAPIFLVKTQPSRFCFCIPTTISITTTEHAKNKIWLLNYRVIGKRYELH